MLGMRGSSSSSTAPSIAIIGAGFSGIGMALRLKEAGLESFTIYEAASDVGGTWFHNAYPGAACDIASHLYSFSFRRRRTLGMRRSAPTFRPACGSRTSTHGPA